MSVVDPGAVYDGAVPPVAPPPAAPPAPAPSAAPPGDADALLDGDLPNQPLFDMGYVRDLRGRASHYRTAAKEAAERAAAYQVFETYDPDDRQVWINLASTWMQNPEEAARAMQQIATSVLGNGEPAPALAADEPEPSTDYSDLTPDAVRQLITEAMQERDQKAAEAAAVREVHSEIRQAGYDPQSLEGMMVLHLAYSETNGDIAQAVEKLRARDQAAFDARVAAARNGQAPLAPSNGQVATSTPTTSESWDDTRRAAQAFLAGSQQGVAGQA